MDSFKYFHVCNHQFAITDNDAQLQEVTIRNSGTFIDILVDRARILDIIEVTVMEYDPLPVTTEMVYENVPVEQVYEGTEPVYYDMDASALVDYSQYFKTVDGVLVPIPLPKAFYGGYLHNRIRWTVKPPRIYKAKVKVLFAQQQYKNFEVKECPRCQGNGWFVDILNQNGTLIPAAGMDRVGQRVIKDLITKLSTNIFDRNYGTVLEKQLANQSGVVTDERLFNDIRLIVSEVEDNYLARQVLDLPTDPSEVLKKLTCSKVYRNPKSPLKIIVDVALKTSGTAWNMRITV